MHAGIVPPSGAPGLGYLAGKVFELLSFFERGLSLMDASSDADLGLYVVAYAAASCAGELPSAGAWHGVTAGVELIWRTHMLHPVA